MQDKLHHHLDGTPINKTIVETKSYQSATQERLANLKSLLAEELASDKKDQSSLYIQDLKSCIKEIEHKNDV